MSYYFFGKDEIKEVRNGKVIKNQELDTNITPDDAVADFKDYVAHKRKFWNLRDLSHNIKTPLPTIIKTPLPAIMEEDSDDLGDDSYASDSPGLSDVSDVSDYSHDEDVSDYDDQTDAQDRDDRDERDDNEPPEHDDNETNEHDEGCEGGDVSESEEDEEEDDDGPDAQSMDTEEE